MTSEFEEHEMGLVRIKEVGKEGYPKNQGNMGIIVYFIGKIIRKENQSPARRLEFISDR